MNDVRQKFTGYERDTETDLDFAQARYYAKNFGRFNSPDEPFADQWEGIPQSWNLYTYVRNNPLNLVDPFGTFVRCPEGVECQFDEDGNEYFIDEDSGEKTYVVETREEKPKNEIQEMLKGAQPKLEFWQPVIEAVQPMPIPVGGVLGRLIRPFVRPIVDAAKGIANFGRGVANFFRIGRRVAQVVCCFVAGTPVLTRDGLVPIEKIEVGDEVLSFNEQTGVVEFKPVVQTFERYERDILRISIEGEAKPVGVTPDHPFYVRVHKARDNPSSENGDGEWIIAELLRVGDQIRLASGGWAKIVKVGRQKKGSTTYNFEVADNHNYFVGDTGILVHNTCTVLQTGRNTLTRGTIKALQKEFEDRGRTVSREQIKQGLEDLKKFELRGNDFHEQILSNGEVRTKTGEVIGNIFDFIR